MVYSCGLLYAYEPKYPALLKNICMHEVTIDRKIARLSSAGDGQPRVVCHLPAGGCQYAGEAAQFADGHTARYPVTDCRLHCALFHEFPA